MELRGLGFAGGVLSISDWHGYLMPTARDLYGEFLPDELDAYAIASDWEAVGQDLYVVLNDRERRRKALNLSTSE